MKEGDQKPKTERSSEGHPSSEPKEPPKPERGPEPRPEARPVKDKNGTEEKSSAPDLLNQILFQARPAYASLKAEILDSETQIERLLNTRHLNPFDVLLVPLPLTRSEIPLPTQKIKENFNLFRLSLHPDKCAHPDAASALAVVNAAYETLIDSSKLHLYLRIINEARKRTLFSLERNKKTEVNLEKFTPDFEAEIRRVFKEIEDKKAELVQAEETAARRRRGELEVLALREEYRLQTEEEWEKTREDRVDRWRKFSKRQSGIGQSNDTSLKFAKIDKDLARKF